MQNFKRCSQLVFCWQIAGYYGDGSPLPPHNPNRTINIEIVEESDSPTGQLTTTTEVELSKEDSVAELWLYPGRTTKRFALTVSHLFDYEQDYSNHRHTESKTISAWFLN